MNSDSQSATYATIKLPCLRGQVQDWIYYVVLLSYSEIAVRFKPAEEIHKNKTLNELLQRALTKRSGDIAHYIIHQKQHFFNAIIAGIYEGEPRWIEISLDAKASIAAEVSGSTSLASLNNSIGVLELSGQEKIFAIDGQHRVEGIKAALETQPDRGGEEGIVIFVAHNGSKSGLERTRRLFSTLNRYAKPVKLGEIIALDEDDAVAITTRRLLYHHHFLKQEDVIVAAKTKNLPPNNQEAWTTIQALYDFLNSILFKRKGWNSKRIQKYLQLRPSSADLESFYVDAVKVLEAALAAFPELASYASEKSENRAAKYRRVDGGYLLFRPIGLSILAGCVALLGTDADLKERFESLATVTRLLEQDPWKGFLFDTENSRLQAISKTDVALASRIWLFLAGILADGEHSKLYTDYAGAMSVSPTDARRHLQRLKTV